MVDDVPREASSTKSKVNRGEALEEPDVDRRMDAGRAARLPPSNAAVVEELDAERGR
jgi:hypothetical protein